MIYLRQSTASQEVLVGPFLDSTDGVTAKTALTIANTDVKIWKAGATAEANKNSGGGTHIASGRYYVVLDATDTDTLGSGVINVVMAASLPVRLEFCVLPQKVYDSLILGTDNLEVDMIQMLGIGQSVTDLKDFADDGYDPSTNKIAGVVLADTVTTYTGNTPQTGDAYARLGAPAGASVSVDLAAVKTDTAAIKTKTDFLPSATAGASGGVLIAGSNAPTTFSSLTVLNTLTLNALVIQSINVSNSVYFESFTFGSTTFATGAQATAIKAKTDNLPSDPADASDIDAAFTSVNATLATIAGYIDTEVGAIKAKTDLIPASPAAVGSAMTLANDAITAASIADNAITDAKIAVPAEAAGRATRVLAMLRRAWEWAANKKTRNRATGVVTLFGADDTTVLETQTQSTAGTTDTQTKGG